MMYLQHAIEEFDGYIRLDWDDQGAKLREKRDRVRDRLYDAGLEFTPFNQGSYAMGLGVRPLPGDETDYDIDVGIRLEGDADWSADEAKRRVFDAVNGHTTEVKWRKHCVRVQLSVIIEKRRFLDQPVGPAAWTRRIDGPVSRAQRG